MTNKEKRDYLKENGWMEVLEDCWIDESFIVSNPNIDYYLASRTTDQAYNLEVERQKKKIIKHKDNVYYVTTDPYEIGDWVITPLGATVQANENNIEVLQSHNAMKIISCTNNEGMKHVGYLIIEKP